MSGRVFELGELTWEELEALDRSRLVAILPVGATEAHGPHLPLETDVIIARAMARAGAARLAALDLDVLVCPPLAYTVAGYAASFAGTISIRRETATALVVDVLRGLAAHGVPRVAIANAHLEPTHIASLRDAVSALETEMQPCFPDVTRKPWALRLTEEFKSGACHAGRYEGSIVMAERRDLVREAVQAALPPNPASLSVAIREGRNDFVSAGGPRAYFGDPAAATAEEGRDSIQALGDILFDAVCECWQLSS